MNKLKERIDLIKFIIGLIILGILLFFVTNGQCASVTDDGKGSQGDILINNGEGQGHKGTWIDITTIPELKGEQGIQGITGKNGNNGKDGQKGDTGKGLKDQYKAGLEFRVADTKYTTWNVYYNRDFNNEANEVGIKIVIKLGSSYEERQIEELKKQINELISNVRVKRAIDNKIEGLK